MADCTTSTKNEQQCCLLSRGTSGLDVLNFDSHNLVKCQTLSDCPECFCWGWSRAGDGFAYCDRKSVHVLSYTGTEYSPNCTLPHPHTREIKYSPIGTYLCLWEPYVVRQGESGHPNLTIYCGKDNIAQYYQKKLEGWCPQWSDDESVCARNVSNEVHFFDGGCPGSSPSCRLQHENLTSFSLSPGNPPFHVAVHIKGTKGAPSSVQLYQYPRVSGAGAVIANKSFYKADSVQLKWNGSGNGLLVLTATDVDKTGASYYGEQNIYYLSVRGEGNMIPLDKKGPVYSIEWSPNGREFCVVYGFMPSKAALFNSKCDMIHDFGITHRNTALYNPHGNILCLAGFGNLRGNMEFWNMDTRKKISDAQASDTTTLSWCPDGIHLVTATTAPRLREGNGYKLWHFSSVLLSEMSVPPRKELWEVGWRPVPSGCFPVPDLSAPPPSVSITSSLPSNKPKQQAYVPPSLRGKPRPSNESSDVVPPSKNKRKRDAQKRNKQQQGGGGGGEGSNREELDSTIATAQYLLKQPSSSSSSATATPSDGNEKKLKNLRKKLKQIETLKQQQLEGKKLEANQIEKLKSEESIIKEISQLELNS